MSGHTLVSFPFLSLLSSPIRFSHWRWCVNLPKFRSLHIDENSVIYISWYVFPLNVCCPSLVLHTKLLIHIRQYTMSLSFYELISSEGAHSFNLVRVVPILHQFSAMVAAHYFTVAFDRWGSLSFSYMRKQKRWGAGTEAHLSLFPPQIRTQVIKIMIREESQSLFPWNS